MDDLGGIDAGDDAPRPAHWGRAFEVDWEHSLEALHPAQWGGGRGGVALEVVSRVGGLGDDGSR